MTVADGRDLRAGGLVVAAVAVLVLGVSTLAYRPGGIHLARYLNDQLGYVTTARWLADTGELRSHLIYPAHLEDPRWRLYMPGHYVALAASFRALGYGPLQARLPGLLAFVVSAVCTFLVGARLYGLRVGFLSAALFVLFPMNGFYAFTAMSEPTLGAAALVSVAVFVFLPSRFQPWLLPVLILLPFLFRETAALLAIPLALLVVSRSDRRRWLRGVAALLGCVVTTALANQWQIASGKHAMPLSWVTHGRFNYADAMAQAEPLPSAGELALGVSSNLRNNLGLLVRRYTVGLAENVEPVSTAFVVGLGIAALLWGWRRRGEDLFPVGVGLLALSALGITLLLYNVNGFRLLRTLLFAYPLLAVVAAAEFDSTRAARALTRAVTRAGREPRALVAGFVALLALGYAGAALTARAIDRNPSFSAWLPVVEQWGLDETRVLVAGPDTGFLYALEHYPVRFAFPPANEETLRLLCDRYDVGAIIFREEGWEISPASIEALGFRRTNRALYGRRVYVRAP